jgi:cytoskeleton protein RodZ
MDDVTDGSATVGERLKAAREEQGITLEDVAARTRIPTRHLESLERSDWTKLPAPTYSIGFAKSYATVVGLDRTEIGQSLREELGHGALAARPEAQVFEPADPARVMPRWLVFAAILALLAVVIAALVYRNGQLSPDEQPVATAEEPTSVASAAQAPPVQASTAAPTGPVVITANEAVWIQVSERGGRTLYQAQMAPGQSYEVPATATAPVLRTGRPQSIRIAVGTADAPAVGAADTTVSNVSLLAADLMRGPAATPAAPPVPTAR